MPELAERRKIGGHGVVVKEAFDHLRQPSPLFGDRPVHLPPQLLLDLLEFGPHTVAPGFPLEQKCAPAAAAADMGEPQEIEGFRFAKPALSAPCRSEAAELDQTGFVRMELQSELLEPSSHRIEKTASVVFMLKAQHQSSSGEESHPSALTEPDVTLSRHPAPTLQPPAAHRVATGRTSSDPAGRCAPASALPHAP